MHRGHEGSGISYVVTDIPEYNRALFKGLLNRLAINVYGKVTFGTASKHLSLINTHTSKPLHQLINDMLKKSDNVIAGALFKKLGQLYTHQPGSWENGSLAVAHILAKQTGLSLTGLRILDGSGISPDNLTTSSQMMRVLDFAYHHYPTSYEFISSLPIAGVDGTLKHRMYPVARKIRAKTGTITGVASLAGYAMSADKEPLAFVIIINGNKGFGWKYRSLEDNIATVLTKYKRT
jgi:D-alanyl-D-alanine carboxypeptidase/D-alanyl-D-alanine-endopeptidase (penicillin-binding protein 4)